MKLHLKLFMVDSLHHFIVYIYKLYLVNVELHDIKVLKTFKHYLHLFHLIYLVMLNKILYFSFRSLMVLVL